MSENTVPPVILDFMARCERCVLKAYMDHGGRGWVAGFGHSSGAGPPEVTADTVWTEEYAREVFHADVARFAAEVSRVIKTPLSDAQFGACVSLAFNMGTTKFKKTRIVELINDPSISHHLIKAADLFLDHTRAKDRDTGQEREFLGLKARRIREAAFFLDSWPPQTF